ncbi:DNA-directed RNA polymerase, mitochondrial [Brachionichthys hirsutus]|uniref:DNA-directed RNA polymerase, mitochondrial n=1 Tax=Brachionichthys hirsutus TaxID=412623 RepID=UPI003604D015
MSLLRLCAFATCLNRRSLFEKCAVCMSFAESAQLCVFRRSGQARRISETSWQLQRRNVSFVNPKAEDGKKRVLVQSQLLDVLEARISQLQSDVILDAQHAKVQFITSDTSARLVLSGKGPKSTPQEKTNIPKGGSKPKSSRWLEKLSKERITKLAKTQHLQQKLQKNVEKKPPAKSKGSENNPNPKNKFPFTKDRRQAAASPTVTPTGVNAATAVPHSVKRQAAVKELERIPVLQGSQRKASSNQQEDIKQSSSENICLGIRCYLEACVFAGDVGRAHAFLLSQHYEQHRRKHLNIEVYNILIRMWAKNGKLDMIGRTFMLLEEAGLKPNLGSYCALLECMGRNMCSPETVARCLSEMKNNGMSVHDVFSQCVFRQDERKLVLKAVRIVLPNFQPHPNVTKHPSFSLLVQDFYTKREGYQFPKLDITRKELQKGFKRQLSIEMSCTVTIDSVEAAKPVTKNMAKMRKLLAEHQETWQKVLLQALRDSKMRLTKTSTKYNIRNLYPYFCLLKDHEYVDIMLQSVANLPPKGELLSILASDLGNKVFTKYSVQQKYKNQIVKKLDSIYNAYTELLAKDTKECNILPREQWSKLEMKHSSGATLQEDKTQWPFALTMNLGIYMMEIMVENLKINNNILDPSYNSKPIPILYHMYAFRSTRQIGLIKPHPLLTQIQQEAMETKLTFASSVMPMLCPPLPWSTVKFGAYLLFPTKLMRASDWVTQHEVLLEECEDLRPVLDSLNQLGNCAWKINKPMLDIIISIFNDRGNDKLAIPPPLSDAPKIPHFNHHDPSYTASEKAHMKRKVIDARKIYTEMHSLRMDALYKLSIANHLRDETFWFPHNMDFRGRIYPCPPYFNHLGNDFIRAILIFAEGKPLGSKGLDWLKIHLINLTGLKKSSSQQQRLEFANSLMEDILDSADNPLNGKKWWMNADGPLQALACCMEISKAMRSPDPTQFISHFPVHQDGSCNGLQHYAALGRDVIGATSVNLMPCDSPQDVYSGVAHQVEERRARDAKNGLKIAKILEGFINRKVVKQTVMTVVYGVTRYGGRLQIEKRLKENEDFPKDYVWEASHYLVRLVFSGLQEMFKSTREIQEWLTNSARLISKSGHSVEWVTPLGLPIIQPYLYMRKQLLNSTMQKICIYIGHDISKRPDTMKQKNAFPPNFIHSLDSTHMMLTALYCYRAGLTFVSVHDCFWTHALTVDTMNKICREQFVSLHNQPILEDLSMFLLNKYCANIPPDRTKKNYQAFKRLSQLLSNVPQTGDFDVQQVKESTYFFS